MTGFAAFPQDPILLVTSPLMACDPPWKDFLMALKDELQCLLDIANPGQLHFIDAIEAHQCFHRQLGNNGRRQQRIVLDTIAQVLAFTFLHCFRRDRRWTGWRS